MELLINIIDVMIINIYFKAFLPTHKKVSKSAFYIIIFILSLGMLFINKQNIYILNLSYLVLVIVIISLFYVGSVKLKIFITLIYTAGGFISETLGLYFLIFLRNYSIVEINQDLLYIASIMLSEGMRILIALFLVKINQNIIFISNKVYYWISGLLLAVIGGCIILMHFIAENTSLIASALNGFMLIVISGITFCCFLIIHNITNILLTENENRMQLQEMEYKDEYYALLKQHYDNIEKMKHDYKNQLLGLSSLAETNPESCKDEISSLLIKIDHKENELLTANYIVNYICRNKFQIAKENDIEIHSELMLPNFLNMNATDISVLYGNLFDNAIEACLSLDKEKRNIYFYTSYKSGKLYIKIYNPYVNEDKIYLNPTQGHGFGLVSVQEIVDKYNGIMSIKKENQIFEINLVLYPHPDT